MLIPSHKNSLHLQHLDASHRVPSLPPRNKTPMRSPSRFRGVIPDGVPSPSQASSRPPRSLITSPTPRSFAYVHKHCSSIYQSHTSSVVSARNSCTRSPAARCLLRRFGLSLLKPRHSDGYRSYIFKWNHVDGTMTKYEV